MTPTPIRGLMTVLPTVVPKDRVASPAMRAAAPRATGRRARAARPAVPRAPVDASPEWASDHRLPAYAI